MNNSRTMCAVVLTNSNKNQLKKEAAQWVAKAKKDSKRWNAILVQQTAKQ